MLGIYITVRYTISYILGLQRNKVLYPSHPVNPNTLPSPKPHMKYYGLNISLMSLGLTSICPLHYMKIIKEPWHSCN